MSSKRMWRIKQLHRQVISLAAYFAVLVAVLGLASVLLVRALRPPVLAPLEGTVIDVAANMGGFDKSEIRVKVGEPVTLRLISQDNQYHTDGEGFLKSH